MADQRIEKTAEQLGAEKVAVDKLAREKTQLPVADGRVAAPKDATPNLTRDALEQTLVGRYMNDNPLMDREEAQRLAKKRALEMIA